MIPKIKIVNYNLQITLILLALIITSCTNISDSIPTGGKPLQVSVTNTRHQSRTLIESSIMPNNAELGVTVLSENGNIYSTGEYKNLKYVTVDGVSFTTDTNPLLAADKAKAAAYYPYSSSATDVTAIPVNTASQTDYMYSSWVTGLDESNSTAKFNMKHALAAIRVVIKKGEYYTPSVTATSIKVQSDAFYASATLDATSENGTLSGFTGPGATVQNTSLNQVLTTTGYVQDFLVVPGTSATDITFTTTINGEDYTVTTTPGAALQSGYIYTYTLELSTQGMSVTNTTFTPWNKEDTQSMVLDKILKWEELPNGVYAVKKMGNTIIPVPYDNVDTNNTDQYIAVALIVNDAPTPQRIMIEKHETDNAAWNGNTYLYWAYDYSDLSLTNFTTADGNYNYGTLGNEISTDYTTWNIGAISDFNGKANTKVIEASLTHARDMCTVLSAFNAAVDQNQGYSDWYIPSCGQLALMYLNVNEINNVLQKIEGLNVTDNRYLQSSEYDEDSAWFIGFNTGIVSFDSKDDYKDKKYRVRFIRDLLPTPNYITFTISGNIYVAEEGMTWEEWVNSDFNSSGIYIINEYNKVYNDNEKHYIGIPGFSAVPCMNYDIIKNNQSYDVVNSGGNN